MHDYHIPYTITPQYHQDRCIPCDVGLTTLRFGATSVDECVVPPPPPVEPVYPTHLTCAQLLMEYRNSTLELQFVGDGLCNPGESAGRRSASRHTYVHYLISLPRSNSITTQRTGRDSKHA